MKARFTGSLLPLVFAACVAPATRGAAALSASAHGAIGSNDLEVLQLERSGTTVREGHVLVRVRNRAAQPVIVGVDVRAEPGMWLAPARQNTSLFYVPPDGERTITTAYAFAHLSPEAALRVRVGTAEEHADGHLHIPEPAVVTRFDMGSSPQAVAFLERFDTRTAPNITMHAIRGMFTSLQLDTIVADRERAVLELARTLGVQPPRGLRIVFYPDAASKTADTDHVGNGLTRGNSIVEIRNESVRLDPYHELAHMLAGQLGWAPAWLNEGFAVWVTERLGADALEFIVAPGRSVNQAVCGYRRSGELFPVAELLALQDIGPEDMRPHVAYPQAASFVGFLAERFSMPALQRAYATMTPAATDAENESAFAQAFGVSTGDAAVLWADWLGSVCSAT